MYGDSRRDTHAAQPSGPAAAWIMTERARKVEGAYWMADGRVQN